MREILFVAGETSGDQHAAGVAQVLRAQGAPFALTGVGGDAMQSAGVQLFQHVAEMSVMGFVEPFKRLPLFHRLRKTLRARLESGRVALVVLVDYGGFNLKIAEFARDAGVPVLYYITPQVWASRAGRMVSMARNVTRAAVILPFEEALLRKNGIDATFVGHPLLDRDGARLTRQVARQQLGIVSDGPVLALFPGSRRQEIRLHLEPFVAAANELRARIADLTVIVSAAPNITIPPEQCPFRLVRAPSFSLLRAADAALCKSGTTTLEAAVALCPLVVAYRADRITHAVARRIIKIPFIGLVNVIAGQEVAREFVQDDLQPRRVADALEPLLDRLSPERAAMIERLTAVRESLGEAGAAVRVAGMALDLAYDAHGHAA